MPLQTRHIYIYGEANFCPDALAKKRGNFSTGEFHSDTRMTASSSGAIFSMKRLANPPTEKNCHTSTLSDKMLQCVRAPVCVVYSVCSSTAKFAYTYIAA